MKSALTRFISYLITLLLGFIIGLGVMLFFYPFIFPPPVLNEQVVNQASKTVIASGQFIHPNPFDPVHYGRGSVSIYQAPAQHYEVFLNHDFVVGPGPAFHVFLSESAHIKTNSDFRKSVKYDLGMLKSFKGSQVYAVPKNIDMSKIKSVVVWCVSFSQLITSANLLSTIS